MFIGRRRRNRYRRRRYALSPLSLLPSSPPSSPPSESCGYKRRRRSGAKNLSALACDRKSRRGRRKSFALVNAITPCRKGWLAGSLGALNRFYDISRAFPRADGNAFVRTDDDNGARANKSCGAVVVKRPSRRTRRYRPDRARGSDPGDWTESNVWGSEKEKGKKSHDRTTTTTHVEFAGCDIVVTVIVGIEPPWPVEECFSST